MMSTRASGFLRLKHERGSGAGKRAADDRDIVIEIHRRKNDGLCRP